MIEGWQPIETAPKDGTPILLWLNPPLETSSACGYAVPGILNVVVGWASDNWRRGVDWECGFCEEGAADTNGSGPVLMLKVDPTHWMPLPASPSGLEREKE